MGKYFWHLCFSNWKRRKKWYHSKGQTMMTLHYWQPYILRTRKVYFLKVFLKLLIPFFKAKEWSNKTLVSEPLGFICIIYASCVGMSYIYHLRLTAFTIIESCVSMFSSMSFFLLLKSLPVPHEIVSKVGKLQVWFFPLSLLFLNFFIEYWLSVLYNYLFHWLLISLF